MSRFGHLTKAERQEVEDWTEQQAQRRERKRPQSEINPYLRTTPGYTMRDMFPTRTDKVCACGCGGELTGRRTRWASNQCPRDAMRLFDIRQGRPDVVRKALMQRDAGLCAGCSTFCALVRQIRDVNPLSAEDSSGIWMSCPLRVPHGKPYYVTVELVPWEAHHLVPVSEGGGGCDLDGYVIMCRACHGKETGALRKRLNGTPIQGSLFEERSSAG